MTLWSFLSAAENVLLKLIHFFLIPINIVCYTYRSGNALIKQLLWNWSEFPLIGGNYSRLGGPLSPRIMLRKIPEQLVENRIKQFFYGLWKLVKKQTSCIRLHNVIHINHIRFNTRPPLENLRCVLTSNYYDDDTTLISFNITAVLFLWFIWYH